MPFRLYHPKLISVSIIRIVLAAGLALALLAGVVPASLSSSAQQTCTMSCCVGKPPHAAGSCSMAFAGEPQTHTHGTTASEDHHHAGAMKTDSTTATAAPEIVEAEAESSSSSHCGTTEPPSAESGPNGHETENASTGHATRQQPSPPSVRAHALINPCSPECAAAAVSNLSQVRRPRSSAGLLTANVRPRPPTLTSLTEQTFELQTSPAVICRQSRPRAPPVPSHNPSA